MDTQLQELIEAIKAEGVQTAEKQAEQIVASAEEKSKAIVADAEKRATEILNQAREEQKKLDQSGREALSQAARDLILGVEARLRDMFKAVTEAATGEAISSDILENTIVAVVTAWSQGRSESLDVLVSESDLGKLEQRLRNRLAEHIASGTEIRASEAIKTGFRVSSRDGGMYYDFTVETIADALSAYVGPRLTNVLREAADNKNAGKGPNS
jgi:V/A-type H+-transporting ATPase subunit E